MAACDCMRGSRKRIMEWGFSMDTGGGCPFFSNFTEFYYTVYGKV